MTQIPSFIDGVPSHRLEIPAFECADTPPATACDELLGFNGIMAYNLTFISWFQDEISSDPEGIVPAVQDLELYMHIKYKTNPLETKFKFIRFTWYSASVSPTTYVDDGTPSGNYKPFWGLAESNAKNSPATLEYSNGASRQEFLDHTGIDVESIRVGDPEIQGFEQITPFPQGPGKVSEYWSYYIRNAFDPGGWTNNFAQAEGDKYPQTMSYGKIEVTGAGPLDGKRAFMHLSGVGGSNWRAGFACPDQAWFVEMDTAAATVVTISGVKLVAEPVGDPEEIAYDAWKVSNANKTHTPQFREWFIDPEVFNGPPPYHLKQIIAASRWTSLPEQSNVSVTKDPATGKFKMSFFVAGVRAYYDEDRVPIRGVEGIGLNIDASNATVTWSPPSDWDEPRG